MVNKYNIVFISSDQHRADHMGCSGNNVVKTENLDKLAKEGLLFKNAFCANPMCMPNRATLLTGYYPNVHGARSNGMKLPEDFPTITKTLRKHGWYTVGIGKFHLQFDLTPYSRRSGLSPESFYDWVFPDPKIPSPTGSNFPIPYYDFQEVEMILGHGTALAGHYMDWLKKKSPKHYNTMRERWNDSNNVFGPFVESDLTVDLYPNAYIVDKTTQFLERHSKGECGNKPFFIHCSFTDPHHPLNPPGKYKDMYPIESIKIPASFDNFEDLKTHPFLKDHVNVMPSAMLRETNKEELKKFISYTYGSISLLDDSVGKILNSINNLGYSDNTIVVYTSDHGDLMGDHGLLFKGPSPFNGVLQVPMIWKVPNITIGSQITESLISSVDCVKTLLSLVGISEKRFPPNLQGFDFTPVLKDPNHEMRDCCLVEHDEEVHHLNCRLRHLITKEYKLTLYENFPTYGDLFHRIDDPLEINNLWDDPIYKDIKSELILKMLHECLHIQSKFPQRIAPD